MFRPTLVDFPILIDLGGGLAFMRVAQVGYIPQMFRIYQWNDKAMELEYLGMLMWDPPGAFKVDRPELQAHLSYLSDIIILWWDNYQLYH